NFMMAGVLAEDRANPEAPPLSAQTLDVYRERLQKQAMDLYEIKDDDAVLNPQRASVTMMGTDHVELVIIYPQPSSWPVHFRARSLKNIPSSYTANVEVFDENEKLLGKKLLL